MKYTQSKGRRFKRYFKGVSIRDDINHWWCFNTNKWLPRIDCDGTFSNMAPCSNIRKFRRMLKHNPIIKGRAVLYSQYINHNVIA